MRKYLLGLLAISMVLLVLPSVFAFGFFSTVNEKIVLAEKNPADWSEIENGASGEVILSAVSLFGAVISQKVRVTVWDLKPVTKYTLIYYGDDEHNDVWPYATCIKSFTTSTQGYAKSVSGDFKYMDFFDNGKGEKFWVIQSSDIDCKNHKMIEWHPTEYLFEHNTI